MPNTLEDGSVLASDTDDLLALMSLSVCIGSAVSVLLMGVKKINKTGLGVDLAAMINDMNERVMRRATSAAASVSPGEVTVNGSGIERS